MLAGEGWKGGATWANTATTLSRYNFSARIAKVVTDDMVGTVLATAGGEPGRPPPRGWPASASST